RFAEVNALPVLASFRRQDLLDNRHPCYAGHLSLGLPPHLQQRVKAADLIVALGTRLGDVTTMTYSVLKPPRIAARLVNIHPDANELSRVFQADLPIIAAPSAAAVRLAEIAPVESSRWRDWTADARREYETFIAAPEKGPRVGVDMAVVIRHLATQLPENATI